MELKILDDLKPTKADIKKAAEFFISAVEQGKENPIDLSIKVKVWEELMKEIKDRLLDYSLDEIDKHGGKLSIYDTKVEKVEAGVKYDYSNDTTWQLLKTSVDYATNKLKTREEILKKIPTGMSLVDEATGEVIVGPSKTSTTTIKITLSK